MTLRGPALAGLLALALIGAGAGTATAATAEGPLASPALDGGVATVSAAAPKPFKGLRPAQRRARRNAVRKCRRFRSRPRQRNCVRRVNRRYRKLARRQRNQKPTVPAAPSRIHYVLVTDFVSDVIQSSYFIPIPDSLIPPGEELTPASDFTAIHAGLAGQHAVPGRITIKSGEAIRFVWDPEGRDSAHQVTLWGGHFPAGVDPRNFEMSSTSAEGTTFQRTFTVPGVYEFRCSLHQLTQILEVTVKR